MIMATAQSISELPRSAIGTSDEVKRARRKRRHALAKAARRVLLGLLVVAAVLGTALALRPRPVGVDIARAERGSLVVSIEETGMTRIKDKYMVSAPVAGDTPRLLLDPGDVVKEGDTLTRLAPMAPPLLDQRTHAEAEARVAAAISALGQARANEERAAAARQLATQELERARTLVAAHALAPRALEEADFAERMRREEVASATFAVKVAIEEVRRARAVLARETPNARVQVVDVVAPVSGRVLRVQQRSAGVVPAGALLLEIGDDSVLEVVVDLLTTDAVHVQPGTPVVIQGWGGDHTLAGRVRMIEPSAFTRLSALGVDEQRVNVIVSFTDPRERWSALRDGYRVEARFVLWRADDVLKVPNGAVFRSGDGWAVYRVEDGRARLTPVVVGHRGETEAEITSGLAAGDPVAVHPGDKVKDGARVAPR
jgi:HlyD family secretion protein